MIKILALLGIGGTVVFLATRGPKKFEFLITNLDWEKKRFDYELRIDGEFQSNEQNVSFNTGSSGTFNKRMALNIIRDAGAGTISLSCTWDGKKVAGKVIDFKNKMVSTLELR